MPKKSDPLDDLSPGQQAKVLHDMVHELFGAEVGGTVWKQMDAALRMKARQIGDAKEPENNFWRGAWKIYELE